MTLGNHILEWFPEGTLYSVVHSKLGGQASLKQEILDETPEEVTADVRALFGRHFPGALKADPLVRVVLEGSEDKQDKQLSAILRWLRGDGRTRLSEYEEARNSLKLYIDFAGKSLCDTPVCGGPDHHGCNTVKRGLFASCFSRPCACRDRPVA